MTPSRGLDHRCRRRDTSKTDKSCGKLCTQRHRFSLTTIVRYRLWFPEPRRAYLRSSPYKVRRDQPTEEVDKNSWFENFNEKKLISDSNLVLK